MSDDFKKDNSLGNDGADMTKNSMDGLFDKLNSMSADLPSSSASSEPSSENASDTSASPSHTKNEKADGEFPKEKSVGKVDIGDIKSMFDTGKQKLVAPAGVKRIKKPAAETKTENSAPAEKQIEKSPAKEKPVLPKTEPSPSRNVSRVSGFTARLPELFKSKKKADAKADVSAPAVKTAPPKAESIPPAVAKPIEPKQAPAKPPVENKAVVEAQPKPSQAKAVTEAPKAAPAKPATLENKASETKPDAVKQPASSKPAKAVSKVSGLTAKIPELFKRSKASAAKAEAPPVQKTAPAASPKKDIPVPSKAPVATPPAAKAPVANQANQKTDAPAEGKRFSPESKTAPSIMPASPKTAPADKSAPKIQPVIKKADKSKKKTKLSNGRKAGIIISIIVILAAVGFGLWYFIFKDMLAAQNADPVTVTSVGQLAGMDMGTNPRYSAVVDPQKSVTVEKDDTKKIAEYFVEEGSEVEEGTPLFSYDTADMQLNLTQAEIDLESIQNRITTLKSQIADLEKQRDKAPADEKPAYTLQISTAQLDVKTEEYNSSVKLAEIEKITSDIANSEVLSPASGIIKTLNKTGSTDPMTGQPAPFISIVARGNYRIKGTVTELNIGSLTVGQKVVVHSRVVESQTWTGTIESIDMENPVSNDSNMVYYGGPSDQNNQSSKYNFYVTLDNYDDLMLGQHVYIEPDTGIDTSGRVGIWLPSFYIDHDDSSDFVWARDPETEKLVKKEVVLGDYDTESDVFQIISGVQSEDYIAYPDAGYLEGMPTVIDKYSTAAPSMPSDNVDGLIDDGSAMVDDGTGNIIGGDDGMMTDGSIDDPFANNTNPEGETDDSLSSVTDGSTGENTDDGIGYFDEDGNFVPMNGGTSSSNEDVTFYD